MATTTEKATRTPGEWTLAHPFGRRVIVADGRQVAALDTTDIHDAPEVIDANARAMAAAPALEAALRALLDHSAGVNQAFYGAGTGKAMRAAMEGQRLLLDQARKALALL